MAYEIASRNEVWAGSLTLPEPDEFNGLMWKRWQDGVNKPLRKAYSLIHLYCYTGLELVADYGEWHFDVPLAEVQAWERDPEAERVQFVALLGRELQKYMDEVLNPKG